mmetsp:Transcript_8798/g.18606  ORF Transcript_8798/g.18606 Transcript_8798/m.18606 type:complete len:421 (+) Transcript_8798:343-1605(+)
MKVHLLPHMLLGVSSIQLWPMVYSRGDNKRQSSRNNRDGVGATRIFHTRIIGGRSAEPDSFPYVVSIQNTISGHYCGGSLIGRDVVLTAAHCGEVPFDQAAIGRQDLSTNEGQEIPISSAVIHPNFNEDTNLNNDVMLIFLENPIPNTNSNVQLVTLNSDESYPPYNSPVTVAGWGRTEANVAWSFSNQLMTVDVNVISNGECEMSEGTYDGAYANYVGQITDGMLCAKGDNKDTCNGDSGGPLVYDKSSSDGSSGGGDVVQVGLVSGGIGCALPDFPGVYTRISHYYEWIREEVCEHSLYPPADFECGGGGGGDGDGEEEEIEARIEVHESSSVREHHGYLTDIDVYGSNDLALNEHLFPHHSAPPCADTDGWKDSFDDGCGWYEINDERGCPEYGDDYEGALGLANDNCCHCMLEEIR